MSYEGEKDKEAEFSNFLKLQDLSTQFPNHKNSGNMLG
jgi:hypothetical protein